MNKRVFLSVLLVALFVIGCNDNTEQLPENDNPVQEEVFQDITEEKTQEQELPVTVKPEPESELEPDPELEPELVIEHIEVTGISLTTYDVTLYIGHKTMPIVTMSPTNATNKGEIWQSSDTSVATVNKYGNITGISQGSCTVTVTSSDNPQVFAIVNVKVIPEPKVECTYIDGILIANKTYPLPQGYAPGWDAEASAQLKVMFAAAAKDGISLWIKSGYRSYIDQKIIYNGYVARDGKEVADKYSARPGHSEHQTGLAFDLNSIDFSFADTREAKWIAENCHKYGFIVRYPKNKESITGYLYEPWHVRYLGIEKATQVYESGLCLEEFLGITSVYSY